MRSMGIVYMSWAEPFLVGPGDMADSKMESSSYLNARDLLTLSEWTLQWVVYATGGCECILSQRLVMILPVMQ